MKTSTNSIIIILVVFSSLFLKAQGCIKVKTSTNITMESGSSIHSINGYNFILEADETSAASLIDRNSSNHVTHASGGESIDQVYITAENWHNVSSPMQNEETGMFLDMYLYDWDESTQAWSWHSVVYDPLTPMKGWAVWSPSSTGSTTREYEGDFNSGDQTYSLTRSDPNAACPVGTNLVGNPYPSAINWESTSGWTLTNVGPTIYAWNSTTGNYGTYNKLTDNSQNGVDSIIPAKQGFFVTVNTGNTSGTISVGNDARVHNYNRAVYKVSDIEFPNLLQLNVSTELTSYSDEAFVIFNKKASENYDEIFDAFKMRGDATAPQLYTDWNGTEYAVNTLKEISEDLIIPLHFEAGINGIYTLDVNTKNLPDATVLFLEDIKLNTFQNLMLNDSYSFASTKEDEAGRFLLHFGAPNGVEEETISSSQIFSFENKIYVNTPNSFSGQVKVFDLLGQEINRKNIVNESTVISVPNGQSYYIVQLISGSESKVEKVFVN